MYSDRLKECHSCHRGTLNGTTCDKCRDKGHTDSNCSACKFEIAYRAKAKGAS